MELEYGIKVFFTLVVFFSALGIYFSIQKKERYTIFTTITYFIALLFVNVDSKRINSHIENSTTEFVSANNPNKDNNFYIGSSLRNKSIYYILRKQVAENTFKDFVIHNVLIKEDKELEDIGFVLYESECVKSEVFVELFFKFNIHSFGSETDCQNKHNSKKTIHVPMGYVTTNLSI